MVLELVLHTLDVQLELLLDLDVVSDLSFVLLEHLLIVRGRLIRTCDTLRLGGLVVIGVRFATLSFLRFLLQVVLMILHLHVHQDLDAGLDVLENGEGTRVSKSLTLFLEHVLIVGIDLNKKAS